MCMCVSSVCVLGEMYVGCTCVCMCVHVGCKCVGTEHEVEIVCNSKANETKKPAFTEDKKFLVLETAKIIN